MLNQIDSSLIVLLILLTCGIFSQNQTIIGATAILILLKISPFQHNIFPYIQQYGLNLGILILTIAVLLPLANGKISGEATLKSFTHLSSIIAIFIGIFVAWLGGRGVQLMTLQPNVVAGLLIGTVLGVAFFRGVPVGPLIAAGLLSLLYWQK